MPSSNKKARAAALAPSIHPRVTHHRPPSSSSSHGPSASSHVEICITNHYAAKVYTTGAAITGEVVLHTVRDLRFDRVALQLVGLAATRNYMAPEVGQVLHRFLLLDMPATELAAALPADHVLRAGRAYTLPFRFVVPHRLPLGACTAARRCEHPAIREHHLRLPPSVGGADAADVWGGRDDGSPETARVRYCVCVAVLQRSFGWAPELVPLLRAHHEVNVLPSYAEDAPLDIQPGGDKTGEYRLAASKTLRRSLVSRRLGVVAVEAAQPPAAVLSADARQALSPVRVALKLRFRPAAAAAAAAAADPDAAALPVVHAVAAKLVARTYYSSSHMGAFPDRERKAELNHGPSLHYSDTSRVASAQLAWPGGGGGWRQEAAEGEWVAALEAVLELPVEERKMLLPTFHSCLLSRTYTLRLVLTVGPGRTRITLSLPLQITVDGGLSGAAKSCEDVPECEEVDDVALPRYKDHLFVQHYDECDTHIPLGIGLIL